MAVSTGALNRVVRYDPRNLTISVQTGLPYAELSRAPGKGRQILPLDPPLAGTGAIGGVIALNLGGPRRRLYGTARDLVIGIFYASNAPLNI